MTEPRTLRTYERSITTDLTPDDLHDVEKQIADKVAELAAINAQLKDVTAPLKEDRKLVQAEIDELSESRETAKSNRAVRCVDKLFGRRVQTYMEKGGVLVDDREATEDELQEELPGTETTEPTDLRAQAKAEKDAARAAKKGKRGK